MKRLILVVLMFLMAGCATTQSTQVTFTQACASYAPIFETMLQLRIAGKLNQAQIDQITLLDNQITPICTGPLPKDPSAAATQVAAAVTTLTIIETSKKASQ